MSDPFVVSERSTRRSAAGSPQHVVRTRSALARPLFLTALISVGCAADPTDSTEPTKFAAAEASEAEAAEASEASETAVAASLPQLDKNAAPDWMARVPGDALLSHLSIPGTHETLSIHGGTSTQCQDSHERSDGVGGGTLGFQLGAGIRAIDIRVRIVGNDKNEAKFAIHHGTVYQKANFDDVLRELRDFLRAHPTETVLLALKAECTGETFSCSDSDPCKTCGSDAAVRRREVFETYRDANLDLFWGPSVTGAAPVPKLDEVRGKVVLVNFAGVKGGNYTGFGIEQLNYADWPDDDLKSAQKNCYVQDSYKVPTISHIDDKWERVHAQLDRTNQSADCRDPAQPNRDKLYFNWTSGSSSGTYPYTVAGGTPTATGVNGFFGDCLGNWKNRCDTASIKRTGVMMMDFPGQGLVGEILKRNPTGSIVPALGANGGAGDPTEEHPGGDDGGARPSVPGDHAACRPDGLVATRGVTAPYCRAYQADGREWLGEGHARRVVGYFNGGRTGADGKPYYLVRNVPWSKVTHINYAFAHIENDRIAIGADATNNPATGMEWPGLSGAEMDPAFPYKGHFNLLNKYKKLHPRVKTLISVGGWAESQGFYTMTTRSDGAVNQPGIDSFADSVVSFLRTYGFDGVDIDFEYPTSLDETGNPQDWDAARSRRKGLPQGYDALMRTLREKLDRASAGDDRYYLLTSASSASGYLVRGMESQSALRYQDFTNLMAYDFHGTWNDVVGPNAPLYDDGKDGELSDLYSTPEYQKIGYFNTDWAFHYLRGALQAGRINIGVPYYTRGWKDVSGGQKGLWGASGAKDCQPGTGIKRPCGAGASGIDNIWHDQTGNGGELSAGISPMWHAKNLEKNVQPVYAEHVGLTPTTDADDTIRGTYTREWDAATRTSWLWNDEKKTFLSTEDEQGVDAIVDFVKASGAGGVMMWELSGDYQCPAEVRPESPCVMGYTLTERMSERLADAAPYGDLRREGSLAELPSAVLDVKVELAKYPTEAANLWPLTPVVRITNNTDVTLGGGKNTTLSFDLPTSTSALIKDGNWQTSEQAGQWRITPGHTGPNSGSGLKGNFHRITTTLDYCQTIPPRGTLELPIIYYLPATGPSNALLELSGRAFSTASDQLRGAGLVAPPAGGCSASDWNATLVYKPATQPIEETTVRYQGKVWRAKWETQGSAPGTGVDADHEPWKLIGPG